MSVETVAIASEIQRAFYNFFHHTFLQSLIIATRIFPESPELTPTRKGCLVVRAFVHATCATRDDNGNIVSTTTREAFLAAMADQYDQTMTDMMVTNAASQQSTGD